ncbi:flagellar motor stator protein MotA [Vibrio sp. SS-MA-C1-2]|uniref:flagellar motor stator protein MotA n=1 Tax=Vibrio sp. SS-MA-C1-2 TaxID=2908646 RepID=UPI001F3AB9BB|nr:flagellar motor stator protein MotA [Vibrio sp. SS-MA-C1-2]UJF18040.1 flagellar motor stator protein MotA [Vibrio sp. SS-MA-C1-2]
MQKIVGFIVIVAVVFGGFFAAGGSFGVIFKPLELMIIFGAAIGGLVISSSMNTLKLMMSQIRLSIGSTYYDAAYYRDLLCLMYELINVARRQNVKVLDNHVENPNDSAIFNKYPKIVKDGTTFNFIIDTLRECISQQQNHHQLEAELEEEIEVLEAELVKPSEKMHAMAESMPGIGILAAVMGIILTMQGLDAEITVIGRNIAAALVGTFTGIFGCYCMFGPLSASLRDVAESQVAPLQCVKSMVIAYAMGKTANSCVNAGRRHIEVTYKPTFTELEGVIENLATTSQQERRAAD